MEDGIKMIRTLISPDVANELEILGDQKDELKSIQKAFSAKKNFELNKKFGLTDEKDNEQEFPSDQELLNRLTNSLLPHQVERLKQLDYRKKIQVDRDPSLGILAMEKELRLSKHQKEKVSKLARDSELEFKKRLLNFLEQTIKDRGKLKKALEDELNDEQKKTYQMKVGPDFFPRSRVGTKILEMIK